MKTHYLLSALVVLIINFSCKKELTIADTKAYEITVKGKVTLPDGTPLSDATIQIENSRNLSDIPEFCCNSTVANSKGQYEVKLPLEESKVNESVLSIYPFCFYQYYMAEDAVKLTKFRDYNNIENKKKLTIEKNLVAVPVGSVELKCNYPSYTQGIVKYKTKNPITHQQEEITSPLLGGTFYKILKALPGEPLEVSIEVYKNNALISQIRKNYTLEKFQLYKETLEQGDFK
ncbi:MAG TPA: carboxypeptidase-like regulatory domain-containing protein [Allocoleopsis sp.]